MPVSRVEDVGVLKRKAIEAGASEETVAIVFSHPSWPVRGELMKYPSSDESLFAEVDRLDKEIIETLRQQGIAAPNTQFLIVITSPYYEPK